MQGTTCSSCGASLPAGAQFCAYCGSAQGGGPPPLATSAVAPPLAPPPPPPGMAPTAPPPGRRRSSRVLLIIVVFLVVVILVGVVAFAFFLPASPSSPIAVPALLIYSPNNVCGLNSNPIYFTGFNSSTSANVSVGLYMPNYNSTVCTIHRITTNTTGFSLTDITLNGVSLPGTIAGSADPSNPVTGTIYLSVLTPSSSYSGNVSLVIY